jgi:hypothetical protein
MQQPFLLKRLITLLDADMHQHDWFGAFGMFHSVMLTKVSI